ncbi:MAG: FkbM family methyltransferase [Methanobacteriaceae archaeon]|jgi:FkbM family methyltransferase|nr:FkbM family methyltransferase [Methanobacteriaceae archaeon]
MTNKLKNLKDYFKYLNNPIQALLFKFNIPKKYTASIKKRNEVFTLNNNNTINSLMHALPYLDNDKFNEFKDYIMQIDVNKKILKLKDLNIINNILNRIFLEYFMIGYWDINVKNRTIIDIGANVGDTSLFFAMNGAKEILGFEPVKELYEMSVKNIEINPKYKNKINLVNKGVYCKKGKLNISMDSTKNYIDKQDSYEVEVITIKEILKKYDTIPDILKIDCEGCEFDIIEHSDLSMFNDIILEHHSNMVGKKIIYLIKKLKIQGFKIKTHDVFNSDFEDLGIIHAYK